MVIRELQIQSLASEPSSQSRLRGVGNISEICSRIGNLFRFPANAAHSTELYNPEAAWTITLRQNLKRHYVPLKTGSTTKLLGQNAVF